MKARLLSIASDVFTPFIGTKVNRPLSKILMSSTQACAMWALLMSAEGMRLSMGSGECVVSSWAENMPRPKCYMGFCTPRRTKMEYKKKMPRPMGL